MIELDGLRAEVLSHDVPGAPRVRFRFDRPLEDPALWFLAWRDGRLRHVALPAVGGEVVL